MAKLKNAEIANGIREELSGEFQAVIPKYSQAEAVAFLNALDAYPTQKNIFIQTLINKVTQSNIFNEKWENPLSSFQKGKLPVGATIEQLFVEDATRKAFGDNFTGSTTEESNVLAKKVPSVKASYITVNFMNKYSVSVSSDQLRMAILNEGGLSNLVSTIINSLYEGAESDIYELTKSCLYDMIGDAAVEATKKVDCFVLNGTKQTPFEAKELLAKLRATSGRLKFKSSKYNIAGVKTHTKKESLVLLVTPEINADLDVNGLASVFNMDMANVKFRVVEVDELPKFTTTYIAPGKLVNAETGKDVAQDTKTVIANLQNIQIDAVVCDEKAFQMYDTVIATRTIENPNNLATNVFYHRQGIAGSNPYAQFVCFGHKTA